jgi:soluble lytic murein transglycosylase-like protein
MPNPIRSPILLCLLMLAWSPAQAGYYVYQLPDGSRLMTDRPQKQAGYKLIKASRSPRKLGKLAAEGYRSSPAVNYLRFEDLIHRIALRYKVDPALVKAVIRTESYFNPNATSRVGATGLMQLMPQTARRYGVTDLYSPHQNIEAGVKHLKYLLSRYPNKITLVLAAYNAGEEAVERYNGIPPYRETRDYINKVLKFHELYLNWP